MAVALALNVSVLGLPVLAAVGLNAAVTPVGTPEMDRFTLPLSPTALTMPIVLLTVLPPGASVTLAAEVERLKLGARTVTEIVVELVSPWHVPVMLTGKTPATAFLPAERVRGVPVVVLVDPNDAVTPVGSPRTDRVTLLANPFTSVMLMALLAPAPPIKSVTLLGEAVMRKLGSGMVNVIAVVLVTVPDFPVIVTG